mmetsp:Transcript_21222/g.58884  ORF Transcript_21222/g.58884 Transcript_21222/m.58884 type:complete len:211 (+) Transcript_21222:419-1051(+)
MEGMDPKIRKSSALIKDVLMRLVLSAAAAERWTRDWLCSSTLASRVFRFSMRAGKCATVDKLARPNPEAISVTISPATSMSSTRMLTCTELATTVAWMTMGSLLRRHRKCNLNPSGLVLQVQLTWKVFSIQLAMRGRRSFMVKDTFDSGVGNELTSTLAYIANLGSSISSSNTWKEVLLRVPTRTLSMSRTDTSFMGRRGMDACWLRVCG